MRLECLCDRLLNLVLYSDVQFWWRLILRNQKPSKGIGKPSTHGKQFGAVYVERHCIAQQHHIYKMRNRRGIVCDERRQSGSDLRQVAWRQVMKQRDMRIDEIAIRRKVRAPESIGPCLIDLTHFGSDDDGSGQVGCLAICIT